MCGRFALLLPPDAMAGLFQAVPGNDLPPVPNYNICPTTQIHVVRHDGDARRLGAMRWGFIPHWYKKANGGPLLINARAETLADKPAFRAAARDRRCLIPASGFYEWSKGENDARLPWYITRRDRAPLVFAGIWQNWGDDAAPTCAIVTTGAGPPISAIHHRVPVVLEPDDWALWLGERGKGAARLMRPPADDVLEFWRVSPRVNSNRAQGVGLIEPVP
ncbi:MAG TPA: SOS response-associated peptidase [Aliiroseovarius sp.]|nr:SOS response-associated peptidase [Aliiroseovarius sp.]